MCGTQHQAILVIWNSERISECQETHIHRSNCFHSKVWQQHRSSDHCKWDTTVHQELGLNHPQTMTGHVGRMEAALSSLAHKLPYKNTNFLNLRDNFSGHPTQTIQNYMYSIIEGFNDIIERSKHDLISLKVPDYTLIQITLTIYSSGGPFKKSYRFQDESK